MTNSNYKSNHAFVAVEVSAQLFRAKKIAEKLAFSSRNLIILAYRIGDSAAGLVVLAQFYNQCSQDCIQLAEQISDCALSSSLNSVKQWRKSLFLQKFNQAYQAIDNDKLPESLKLLHQQMSIEDQEKEAQIMQLNRQLSSYIEDIQRTIRTIAIVVVNARIEAPNAGQDGDILEKLASEVSEMTEKLKVHINRAVSYLE